MDNCPEEFKKMMMELDSDDDESEQIAETFICCICRDLLYKPVVLGCGHVSCFWCVHKSMSVWHKSQCPICRNQYFHFPCVCQTLHFLLLKLYPIAYKRREKQTLEEENETGNYSPQLVSVACPLQPKETIAKHAGDLGKVANLSINKTGETSERTELVESNLAHRGEDIGSVKYNDLKQIQCNVISVGDVLCGSSKHMLCRPIVLNCGHAFCICCVVRNAHEMLKCEVCQCPHPGDFPKVCLEFDQFLEKQFPAEYKLRRDSSQMKQDPTSSSSGSGSDGSCTSKTSGQNPLFDGVSIVHYGVGCDSCGMSPIVGDRYKCKDCTENIGYDLCKDCFTSGSEFPGRFNQHHTSDHEFEVVNHAGPHALGVFVEQFSNIAAIAAALRDAYNMDGSLYEETNEDSEDDDIGTLPSSDRRENERGDEQSYETI